MKKVLILGGIILVVVGLFVGLAFLNKKDTQEVTSLPDPTTIEYYWGNGCPHCAKVAEFMDSWTQPEDVKIDKYEVWYDKGNSARLTARATQLCNVSANNVGVPFMITPDKQCITGDQPIIDYLKSLGGSSGEASPSATPSNP